MNAVFYTESKVTYYWGKVLKTFSNDVDDDVNKVEFQFMQRSVLSSDTSQWKWTFPATVPTECVFVFYGPELPDIGKNVFTFPDGKMKRIWSKWLEYLLQK